MTIVDLDTDWRMLVAGRLTGSVEGGSYLTRSPSTGEVLAKVPAASARDVAVAVEAAAAAQHEWHVVPPRERGSRLRHLAQILRENRHELAYLDAIDGGNPITAMESDVEKGASALELFADWADQLAGETHLSDVQHLHYTLRQPFGVVARIVPFNHPLMFAASKIGAPLMAGNAVILKAPDQTPLSSLRMAELFTDALPSGLLTVLSGHGHEVGAALVSHPGIRRIAFTGSLATGQAILQNAAATGIKSVTLELGGKNVMLVRPDADAAAAGAGAVEGMNFAWTAGQSCGSTSRLMVHESLADEIIERVLSGIGELRLGDPLDPTTEMGSLVSFEHRDKVQGYIDAGHREGLKSIDGGQELDSRGAFVRPTVFLDVPETSVIAREEIFGPVLAITRYSDEAEALNAIDQSPYGLTTSIWTQDVAKAHQLSHRIQTGYVWVNTSSRHFVGLPFGGIRDSGLGREECVEELHSFTETKSVTVRLG